MEKTILIVSDLHLGAGKTLGVNSNPLEDFDSDEKFADFLLWKRNKYQQPLELIILGDAFDFPQVLPDIGLAYEDSKLGITQEESLRRLEVIIQGHETFFGALRDFLFSGNKVRLLRGNHDIDLIWPDVQARLRREMGDGAINLIFESDHVFQYKGLYCEHGNQYSVENAFSNPLNPVTTDSQGKARLERCWGTYFVDVVYNEIETRFPLIDNVEDGQMIRGALMAIKSERFKFTGKMVAKMLKIAYRSGLPVTGWIGSGIMGEPSPEIPSRETLTNIATPKEFLANLRDPELSRILLSRFENEKDFRLQFESEMNDVVQEQADQEVFLLPFKNPNQTMGLITGKNPYQRAAERILKNEEKINIVVFGHTHSPVDGNFVTLSDESLGKYFNSGSWTNHIDLDDPRNQGMNFDELCDFGILKKTLDYVEVTFTSDGNQRAVLGSA